MSGRGPLPGSIALVGWGLASFVEGIASAVIVWRFTGDRRLSDTAEHRAQKLVAIQFFILAPYVLMESARTLIERGHADVTVIGMVLTGTSVVLMPLLGRPSTGSPTDSARLRLRGRGPRMCSAASRPPPFSSGWPPTPRSARGGSTRSSACSSPSSPSRKVARHGEATAALTAPHLSHSQPPSATPPTLTAAMTASRLRSAAAFA